MGYADIGPFGATDYPTPNLDRMASEGRIFTDFHSATAVCSASRAALLTGCYPERVSILGALFPRSKTGLHTGELTMSEFLKSQGYRTGIFGKWHLGHLKPFLPLQHGFDEYFGLPYSNDMWPHPDVEGDPINGWRANMPPLPLYQDNEVVNAAVTAADQAQLTTWYTQHAVEFIENNADKPFFLYLPHTMVHVPIFVSDKFKGKSGAGLYGDVVMELDWSVGQVLEAIKRTGVDDNTLVIFTSDNGPWLTYGNHGGSAGKLREGKGTMFEGGYREPCIMRWPGKIPAGTQCDQFATTMDLLPTLAQLLGIPLPVEHPIDGKNILPLICGEPEAKSPHEIFYGYFRGNLQMIRDQRWKLHFPRSYTSFAGLTGGKDGRKAPGKRKQIGLELYDLKNDLGETTNVADQHPDIVARLQEQAEIARQKPGDTRTERKGSEVRASGQVE